MSDNSRVLLETGFGYIVNIKSGREEGFDNNTLEKLASISENCQKPKGWKYNKFPE
ncbi:MULTISPECIES: hypothetical protein [unclassified Serratia (in: enterobacteria)]|uniref:hypothetical protein n=1 Tax=unclassified Serratia (in: enterobacteria) TaxID=2647522 RepID=UPI0030764931